VDNLPHFLLLLLILQRFDDAKWGYLTECPESRLKVVPGPTKTVATALFVGDNGARTVFHPGDDEVYMGITMLGRGTGVIGGRKEEPPEAPKPGTAEKLREGNDLVVKIYWPEENRMSEVDILDQAMERGKKIDFIINHIPEVVSHADPVFLCGSTKTIRQFLGLGTGGTRRLRIIVFRRLRSIKELKEKDMLTAYLQAFFCKCYELTM
jgi:hypothetical protein